jgi:LemA protein
VRDASGFFHGVFTVSGLVITVLSLLGLFWAVGAYNRLTRMRNALGDHFARYAKVHEARLALLLRLAHAQLLHRDRADVEQAWHDAEDGLQRLANALAHAAARPTDAERIERLRAEQTLFDGIWLKARELSADLVGAPWPRELQDELSVHDAGLITHGAAFDAAVHDHNSQIAMWPAAGLAYVFGLKPCATLTYPPTGA